MGWHGDRGADSGNNDAPAILVASPPQGDTRAPPGTRTPNPLIGGRGLRDVPPLSPMLVRVGAFSWRSRWMVNGDAPCSGVSAEQSGKVIKARGSSVTPSSPLAGGSAYDDLRRCGHGIRADHPRSRQDGRAALYPGLRIPVRSEDIVHVTPASSGEAGNNRRRHHPTAVDQSTAGNHLASV